MADLLSIPLSLVSISLTIPVAVLLVEAIGALGHSAENNPEPPTREWSVRVAVIVPAHDEGDSLKPTLADLQSQLLPSDRLLVVADNCSDNTAAIAAAAGATVSVRDEPTLKGKGYALAWGVDYLRPQPPDIVIVVDADCRIRGGAISWLTHTCFTTGRPVQALDLMLAPSAASSKYRLMEFVWRIKNWVRPLGLHAAGLPCQLMGTGMAFPWAVISQAKLATGSLVEDMKLGIDLATENKPALFCPYAVVTSEFPLSEQALQAQRTRWERGHLGLILAQTPRVIGAAARSRNFSLFVLSLDAAVPPLSLLVTLICLTTAVSGACVLLGASFAALIINCLSLLTLASVLLLSWMKFGRDLVSGRELLSLILLPATKAPIYYKILFRKSAQRWIRTDRRKM